MVISHARVALLHPTHCPDYVPARPSFSAALNTGPGSPPMHTGSHVPQSHPAAGPAQALAIICEGKKDCVEGVRPRLPGCCDGGSGGRACCSHPAPWRGRVKLNPRAWVELFSVHSTGSSYRPGMVAEHTGLLRGRPRALCTPGGFSLLCFADS